jgi:hypothetical protein
MLAGEPAEARTSASEVISASAPVPAPASAPPAMRMGLQRDIMFLVPDEKVQPFHVGIVPKEKRPAQLSPRQTFRGANGMCELF